MEILKKLQSARKLVKETDIKKEGKNTYSDYNYFTPSQISDLVFEIEQKLNIFHKFDLMNIKGSIYGLITLYDLDSNEDLEFKMLTDIPQITATNKTQQLGGAMTYTNRYLLMNIYDIQDNSLDFDTEKKQTKKQTKKTTNSTTNTETEKEWLKDEEIDRVVKFAKENGLGAKDLYEYYKISNKTMDLLKEKF